jgi:hypothetical protein
MTSMKRKYKKRKGVKMAKRKIKHAGIVADVEEEDTDEIRTVNRRKKFQKQPEEIQFWTPSSIEAEKLVNKGAELEGVLGPFDNLPKRWVFKTTKEEAQKLLKEE